jgi:hypothetical protein
VSEGNYVVTSTVPYYPDIENGNTPGAKIIREFAKAKGRSPYSDLNMAYVRGWVHVNIMYKALSCPDQIVDLTATDATAQMLKFKECGADFIWTGGTAASTIVIMRDAKKVGLNAIVITNTWGTNEAYMRANPDVSEGNYVVTSTVPYYPDIENGNTRLSCWGCSRQL